MRMRILSLHLLLYKLSLIIVATNHVHEGTLLSDRELSVLCVYFYVVIDIQNSKARVGFAIKFIDQYFVLMWTLVSIIYRE